jgi:hypothetical protein
MTQKFANNARSRLVGALSDSATSFTIESATADLFPIADTPDWLSTQDWFKATIENSLGQVEIVHVGVRGLGSGVFSNVLRGQDGTTAIAFGAGSTVGCRITAQDVENAIAIRELNNTFSGNNTFTGDNTFEQPIDADIMGNAATADHADTADAAGTAAVAAAVADGAIDADAMADEAVTTAKLGDGAATTPKIADDAVTLEKLAQAIVDRLSQTGDVKVVARNSPTDGWVKANGQTIGNAASGATNRANADTEALFTLLWNEFPNAVLAIQDSAGAASTRGASAAADYAANKRLPVHDVRGEGLRGWDDGRGVDTGRVLGSAQLDSFQGHGHNVYGTNGAGAGSGVQFAVNSASPRAAVVEAIDAGAGAGTPRVANETRMRNVAFLVLIKL